MGRQRRASPEGIERLLLPDRATSLRAHDFVAPLPSQSPARLDGWPPELERKIAAYVMQLPLALHLCASGKYLAVFPDVVVSSSRHSSEIRKLPIDIISSTDLYAIRRRRVSKQHAVELVVETLQRHWKRTETTRRKR